MKKNTRFALMFHLVVRELISGFRRHIIYILCGVDTHYRTCSSVSCQKYSSICIVLRGDGVSSHAFHRNVATCERLEVCMFHHHHTQQVMQRVRAQQVNGRSSARHATSICIMITTDENCMLVCA